MVGATQLKRFSFWLLGLSVLILFEWVGVLHPVVSVLERGLRPVLGVNGFLFHQATAPFFTAQSAWRSARRVQELEAAYASTQSQLADLEAVRQENEELRQLLALPPRNQAFVLALPLTASGLPGVTAGKREGIVVGQPVVARGLLLGLISQVSDHQSHVTLLNSVQATPILAKTESGIEGIVSGDGRRVLLRELPREVEVITGERVVTVGQPGIPQNIVIGTVHSVLSQPTAPVQTGVVEQSVSFYQVPALEIWQ